MRHAIAHLALFAAVVTAPIVAACGGGGDGPQGPGPHAPTASAPATGPGGTVTAAPQDGGATPTGPSTAKPGATPTVGPMKAIAASTMEAQIKELGLDMKALPALNKIERPKLMKVMQSFQKALGTTCNGCHEPNDFRAWTPKKKIAAKMWDEFVRKLALEDGTPLYCDSCHNGHMEFLDRHDKKELGKWMDANFVSKLKRVDKKDHGCDTCHGDPFEGNFLKAWAK